MTSAEQEVDRLLTVCLEEIAKAKKESLAEAAALCREAGCICGRLAETDRRYFESVGGRAGYHWGPAGKIWEINRHAGICPYALAARIEALALGKEK